MMAMHETQVLVPWDKVTLADGAQQEWRVLAGNLMEFYDTNMTIEATEFPRAGVSHGAYTYLQKRLGNALT